jgi:hypothetical protein
MDDFDKCTVNTSLVITREKAKQMAMKPTVRHSRGVEAPSSIHEK